MDMLRWLMRAKRWAQHPPPMRRVILMAAVVAASLAIAGIEHYFGWPDWLKVNRLRP